MICQNGTHDFFDDVILLQNRDEAESGDKKRIKHINRHLWQSLILLVRVRLPHFYSVKHSSVYKRRTDDCSFNAVFTKSLKWQNLHHRKWIIHIHVLHVLCLVQLHSRESHSSSSHQNPQPRIYSRNNLQDPSLRRSRHYLRSRPRDRDFAGAWTVGRTWRSVDQNYAWMFTNFRLPVFFFTILQTQKCAFVFTCMVFSMSESEHSRNFFPVTIPALFIRMSTSPTSALTLERKHKLYNNNKKCNFSRAFIPATPTMYVRISRYVFVFGLY